MLTLREKVREADNAPCPYCRGTGILWAQIGRETLCYLPPDYPTHTLLIPLACQQPHWEPKQCPHLGVTEFSPAYGEEKTP